MNVKLIATEGLSEVTKLVVKDFNTLTNSAFFAKYACNKAKYLKRFIKYGDPFMKSPLAQIGKFLSILKK